MCRYLIAALGLMSLAACGGGGGSGFTGAGPGGGGGSWTPGVFLDANTFFANCAVPRAGIDPATGNPFADVQGTTTDENNFLRSYSNDTYLWYDEIVDQDPALFDTPTYFNELKTNAPSTTGSGQRKDKFHFTIPSDEWFELSRSGVSAGYGAEWLFLTNSIPGEVLVAFTEPGTPATSAPANLARGVELLSVDGIDPLNVTTQAQFDQLLNALFPAGPGEQYVFVVRDRVGTQRQFSMTSTDITTTPVQNVRTIPTTTGDVGYILFNTHLAGSEAGLINAVNQLQVAGITDLVIDVRYNGGGFLDVASEFAYMIAGPVPTAGKIFETVVFNDKHPTTDPVTGQPLSPTLFHTTTQGVDGSVVPGQPLPTLNLSRVFVLTGPDTCSASESIMNGLQGVDVEVFQFGSTTCGKPYGFYATGNCGTHYFTIQFRGENHKGFGGYSDGFSAANQTGTVGTVIQGCSVADDFSKELGDETEERLAAALMYRQNQTCPLPATGIAQPAQLRSLAGPTWSNVNSLIPKRVLQQNRILR